MKLLVIEGNPRSIWQQREAQGGIAYHRRFLQLLEALGYQDVDVAFPVESYALPDREQLTEYNGILLTGSSLNVYDDIEEVNRQLDFAEHCFWSGVPIYGSCWGLQIAVTVAGGQVGRSKNGREFGVAEQITLTKRGKESPYFSGKPHVFDAYCIHEDDTHQLPENAEVLATNQHSDVQALQLHYRQSAFFGVQYHPEFIYDDAAFLADLMQDRFVAEGIFNPNRNKTACLKQMAEHPYLNNGSCYALEVVNWLKLLQRLQSHTNLSKNK